MVTAFVSIHLDDLQDKAHEVHISIFYHAIERPSFPFYSLVAIELKHR